MTIVTLHVPVSLFGVFSLILLLAAVFIPKQSKQAEGTRASDLQWSNLWTSLTTPAMLFYFFEITVTGAGIGYDFYLPQCICVSNV